MVNLLKILWTLLVVLGAANVVESEDSVEGDSTFIVSMLKGTEPVLRSFSTKSYQTHAQRVETLAKELQDNARISQEPVHKYLETVKAPNFEVKSMWLQNALILKKPPADVILHLKTHFSHLLSVRPDSAIRFDDPPSSSPLVYSSTGVPTPWGIKRIQAEEAVKLLQSSLSTPFPQIRVANIDTGVRWTHEALRDNYIGAYGWFDPAKNTQEPTDDNGHGTHTMGTICGRGIGVFPNATWMACRQGAWESTMIECAQFLTCPTLPDRSSPNCSMAPHLVSNSWNLKKDAQWFDSSIDAWRAVGIIPIFITGNNNFGDRCCRAKYPGGSPAVISVGATQSDDKFWEMSCKGPTSDGRIKPDFVAPGKDVNSASHKGDTEYVSDSGTSMAGPHVAGLVALLLAYDQNLKYDQIVNALKAGVQTSSLIPPRDLGCDHIPSDTYPNNNFGYGLINALRSLTHLIDKRKH